MWPFDRALLSASSSAWLGDAPDQLLFETFAPWATAYDSPWMKLATLPLPVASIHFTSINCVTQLTPETPTALLPVAPMVPATWVPWLLSSSGRFVLVTKFQPTR